jgi:stage III sporulation protein AF
MSQVAEWLRSIVAAIILAGFIEMMLPNNELKNVTRLIMGLVIMSVLLQPLIRFFDLPGQISLSLPSISSPDPSKTQQIINKGLKMRDEWTRQIQEQNQKTLESKLKNIIGLIGEVQLDNLRLRYQGEKPDRAFVQVKLTKQKIESMGEISDIKRKVIHSIQFLTDLREDQIEVNLDGR